MHAQIAEEAGEFTLEDVIEGIATKLVRRHPHVFGGQRLHSPQQVLRQWEELKRQERGEEASVLQGVPRALPALAQTQALLRRAVPLGLAAASPAEAQRAVQEALASLATAGDQRERQERLGQALFALVDLARLLECDAEDALLEACGRFRRRVQRLEELARARGLSLHDLEPEGRQALWREAAQG